MINLCSLVPNLDCCFELFGLDIMIDDKYKPWLIEVNSGPQMSMDSGADYKVKPAMLRDMIKATNYQPYDEFFAQTKIKNQKANSNFFTKRGTGVNMTHKSVSNTSSKPQDTKEQEDLRSITYVTSPKVKSQSFAKDRTKLNQAKIEDASTEYGLDRHRK